MDDVDVVRFWRRPNTVSLGVKLIVIAAAAVTAAMVYALAAALRAHFPDGGAPYGAPALAGLAVLAAAVGASSAVAGLRDVSWWARGAIVLAAIQLTIVAAVAVAWWVRPPTATAFRLVDRFPAHLIALTLGVAVIVAAALRSPRRGVPPWLAGTVVFALVDLLAVGIWLPITAWRVHNGANSSLGPEMLAHRALPLILIPPAVVALVVAVVVTVAARRHRRIPDEITWMGLVGLGAMLWLATTSLYRASDRAVTIYESYGRVVVAGALFAVCALIALATAHLRALLVARADAERPAPWVQRGIVSADGPSRTIARHVFHGWLGGFTSAADGFALCTDRGLIHVPPGAHLIAPLGAWTTDAAAGDVCDFVPADRALAVSGFVTAPDEGPFRTGAAPIAGADGLVVSVRRTADESIRRDVVLVLWRPCLLLLLAAVLAGLPAVTASRATIEPPSIHVTL